MKHQITTSIIIEAPIEKVWDVFVDFKNYPSWNPFIKSIEGPIAVGEKFKAAIGGMKFKPVTQVFSPMKEFTWQGQLGLPRIFDGQHSFVFTPLEDGSTRLVQSEQFRGLLVPLMKKKLNTETLDGFKAMNEALKELAEERSSSL